MSASTRADSVAAWAVGIGVGLIVLQLSWLLLQRITSYIWQPPVGPVLSISLAVVFGLSASIFAIRRLVRQMVVSHGATGRHRGRSDNQENHKTEIQDVVLWKEEEA